MVSESAGRRGRGRGRWKLSIGGVVVLFLLWLLGDRFGMFQPAERGPSVGTRSGDTGGIERDGLVPDAQLAVAPDGGATGDPSAPPSTVVAGATGEVEAGDGGGSQVEKAAPPRSDTAQVDQAMGLIHRFEQALAEDRLLDLAILVDRLRTRPVEAPAGLVRRWNAVRARAESALQCGERLRGLVRQGQVMAALDLIEPLLVPAAPDWMRTRLDQAAETFGWPALTRGWELLGPSSRGAPPATDLPKLRSVRFRRGDAMEEGVVWRCDGAEVTLRRRGREGFTFPMVARHRVEPIDPTPAEARMQGWAAVGAGDARSAVLWSCYFRERGDAARASEFDALVR